MHADGTLLEEGDIMRRPKLAETLRAVANQGPAVLYTGSLAESFLQDIHDHGRHNSSIHFTCPYYRNLM